MTRPLHHLLPMSLIVAALALTGCGSNMTSSNFSQNLKAAPAVSAVAVQVDGNAPNRKQEVQFNEPMDPATINSRTFQVADSSGNPAPGAVTYDANFDIASFQPSPALRPGATYTATITTAATSAAGVHLAKPYTYNFTTRAKTDASPIKVISVSPAANATCVSPDTLIMITFDEAPDAATLLATNFGVTGPGGDFPVKVSTNVSTTQVVLQPISSLPIAEITVFVNGVGDLAGVKMTTPYTWSFSTACDSGGGTGGGSATTQYQAPLFSETSGLTATNGQVTVDASGNTTIQLTGAPAGATYTAQFCPVVIPYLPPAPSCFNVVTVSSDTAGNGTAKVKFPRPGNWAGDFYLNDSTGKDLYQTFLSYNVTHQTYISTLLPISSVNGGAANPSSNGTVTLSNGSVAFSVKGASPNTLYNTGESETNYFGGSGTYQLSTFTTDARGDGSSSTQLNSTGGDIFDVDSQTPGAAVFMGGFSIP
jgi:hypothetical protein